MTITPRHHELRVIAAMNHGPTVDHKALRFALSREFLACAVIFSEAYRHEAFLRDRPSWRATMPVGRPDDDRDTLRGKMDAPVLVRRHHPLIDSWSVQACGRSVPIKLAPPRYFNGQTFAHELGEVEVVAAHPHAAIIGHPEGLDRVQKYAHSMRVLEAHVDESIQRGRLVVVGGDLNYPDVDGPSWSPPEVFRRLGLRTWCVGVGWLAWSPRLVPLRQEVIGRDRTRQDHPWMFKAFTGFRHA